MALGVLVGGILIDLDHFIDYFLYRGFHINLQDMFHLSNNNLFPRFYLLLHSYELLALIWIAIIWFTGNKLALGIAIGLTIHLVQDEIGNRGNRLFYFLTFRAIKKFDKDKLVTREFRGKPSSHSSGGGEGTHTPTPGESRRRNFY